jgi:hypothetical protein
MMTGGPEGPKVMTVLPEVEVRAVGCPLPVCDPDAEWLAELEPPGDVEPPLEAGGVLVVGVFVGVGVGVGGSVT